MILKENEQANVCVRGIVIEDGDLVLTGFTNREESFLLGGRVEYGEPIIDVLHREMYEETAARVLKHKLIYFSENIFLHQISGRYFHEYGWYFLVELDRSICKPGEILPNPDAPDLIIKRLPITDEGLSLIYPTFLRDHLVADYRAGFTAGPRAIYNNSVSNTSKDFTAELFHF